MPIRKERGVTISSPDKPATMNVNAEEFWLLRFLRTLSDQNYRLKQYQKHADVLAQKHGRQ
ncbi:MAG TPA: hypothetical protein VFG51_02905 [Candidatus Saccharimonadia bacterium]|nr:hypothetical protein [Candidatus Saccharimonadia bacterium]